MAPDELGFVDESGAWQLPLLAHFGEAFSAFVHGRALARGLTVKRQLELIKAAGYDGIRFWDTLGYYPVWRGREVMPWTFVNERGQSLSATPGYYERLEAFLILVRQTGLVAQHSRGDLNGRSTDRVVEHTTKVADIYDRIGWHVLALFEGVNESWQNGGFNPAELRRIVAPAAERGALIVLSCPPRLAPDMRELRAYARGASVVYVHGEREGTPADRLRQQFVIGRGAARGLPRLGWQGEPTGPGPGVSIQGVDDPEELALLAANSLLSRQAWVYMSSHGVFWNGAIHAQPGFAVVPAMREALAQFAPDVMAFQTLVPSSSPDAVLKIADQGALGVGRAGTEPPRADQALSIDGRLVAVVYGGSGQAAITNAGSRELALSIVWAEHESLRTEERTVAPGQAINVAYRVGRLILARPARR